MIQISWGDIESYTIKLRSQIYRMKGQKVELVEGFKNAAWHLFGTSHSLMAAHQTMVYITLNFSAHIF